MRAIDLGEFDVGIVGGAHPVRVPEASGKHVGGAAERIVAHISYAAGIVGASEAEASVLLAPVLNIGELPWASLCHQADTAAGDEEVEVVLADGADIDNLDHHGPAGAVLEVELIAVAAVTGVEGGVAVGGFGANLPRRLVPALESFAAVARAARGIPAEIVVVDVADPDG